MPGDVRREGATDASRRRSPRRSGNATSSIAPTASRTSSTSTSTSSTRSPARRRSTGCAVHGRTVRRPDLTVATMDHNVPTTAGPGHRRDLEAADGGAVDERGRVRHHAVPDGLARPGHRARDRSRAGLHAAGHDDRVRRLAHVDARRVRRARVRHRHDARSSTCSPRRRFRRRSRRRWPSRSTASCRPASRAKDVILAIIARIGTGGGVGHVIEYRGSAIRALSMEGRMTVCNMSIEAGARAGMVAPDDTTFAYVEGRPHAPHGADWERALDDWRSLPTDDGATFDKEVTIDAADAAAVRHVGHEPEPERHDRRRRARPRGDRRRRQGARRPSARSRTWRSRPARRSATSARTRSSSARARTRASRTCASPPASSAGARSPTGCARSSSPARSR